MNKTEIATTLQLIRRLILERWRPYYKQYALAIGLMFVVAGTTAVSAWMMKDVINEIFVAQNRSALYWIPLTVVMIYLVKGFSAYFQEVILTRVGSRFVADTQKQLFDHILKMNVQFYNDHPSSDLITRITYSASAASSMLNLLFLGVGRDLMTLLGLVAVMWTQDPALCLSALVVGPPAWYGLRHLSKRIKEVTSGEATNISLAVGVVREATQGIRIVKSFRLEGMFRDRMHTSIDFMRKVGNRIVALQAAVNPLIETLGGIAVALVIVYAGWRSQTSAGTPGEFFAFVTALLMASDPARRLSRLQLQLVTASIGVRLMYDMLDTPASEVDAPGSTALIVREGRIEFSKVGFHYTKGTKVLDDLSLVAPAGKTTALVGTSGGGKTTVLNLLQRFWLPQDGQILIDGQNIAAVSLDSLRRQITYVSQDVFLFEGTIKDNIRCGDMAASDDMVKRAAEQAHAATFIAGLSKGYDTKVGELGTQLSGGQRQRISMARAFLKDAPIILLDEPTSALDSESEQIIQEAIKDLTRGKTTIVIAHRLATILKADVIHVIEHGRVVESGRHDELVRSGNLYSKLHAIQFAA